MTHKLDATYGLMRSMVYAGDLPWHRYGTQIQPGLTVEEAIAACPAVDFETVTVPVRYSPVETGDPLDETVRTQLAGNHRVIIRSDTGAALGVATSRYSPVQIRDQWKGLDPLIEAGLATIETLGSIEGGKRVWGLVKLKGDEIPEWKQMVEQLGEIENYALAMDDKTGSRAALLAPTGTRVVCHNTLEAAVGGLTRCVRVPHKGDTRAKMEAAAEQLWGGIVKTYQMLSKRYLMLDAVTMSKDQHAELVLDEVAVVPTDPDKFSSYARFKGAQKRAEAKRDAVYELWFDGAGHKGTRTAWEALNGAVEAFDHNKAGAFRTPKGDGKVVSMLTGTEAQLKASITRNLLTFAKDQLAA